MNARPFTAIRLPAAAALVALALAALALGGACSRATEPTPAAPATAPAAPTSPRLTAPHAGAAEAEAGLGLDAGDGGDAGDAGPSAPALAAAAPDPVPLHKATRDELLGLFSLKPLTDTERARILPEPFLRQIFGAEGPHKINQGNPALAQHEISRAACLAGLAQVTLQTPAQRALCGHDNMVPVHLRGKDPYFCIDIFEFPNKACELPFVWTSPTYAKKVCELSGKRLCSQIEWQLACHADPNDGPDTRYAYGDTLDLAVCHTQRRHRQVAERPCTLSDAQTAWRTCSTDTEPSGAYPRCRSRYGVYDQHGNVAEIMMRRDGDGLVKSQLKGSAWFYDEVAREVGGPPLHAESRGAYPDHCNFDPRWHVENIENAWHVNYHLGFRCCKSVP